MDDKQALLLVVETNEEMYRCEDTRYGSSCHGMGWIGRYPWMGGMQHNYSISVRKGRRKPGFMGLDALGGLIRSYVESEERKGYRFLMKGID